MSEGLFEKIMFLVMHYQAWHLCGININVKAGNVVRPMREYLIDYE